MSHVGSYFAAMKAVFRPASAGDVPVPAAVADFGYLVTVPPVTEPQGTRAYDFANSQRTAIGEASSAAVALPTLGASREIMLHASSRCFIRFGASNVAAAQAAAGQLVLEAGERFHIRVPAGVTHYRVIRDTADGFLNVTAVA